MVQGPVDPGTGFQDVDQSGGATQLIGYLDQVAGFAESHALKRRIFALLKLQSGHRVLDVGCGTGDDVRGMAELVGAVGQAVGIDQSEVMIQEAERRSVNQSPPVEFRVMDAHHLDFPDGTFDSVRAERVLQHAEAPTPGASGDGAGYQACGTGGCDRR
jgi:ubiquinone/menaquinone biosynthesis C-methylase UbiE